MEEEVVGREGGGSGGPPKKQLKKSYESVQSFSPSKCVLSSENSS